MPTSNPKLLELVRKNFCCGCGLSNYIHSDGSPRVEAHHIQTKGMGNANGGDDWWNLIPLCTNCHTAEEHAWHRDLKAFFRKYPHVWKYLRVLGWEHIPTGYKVKLIHPAYVNLKPKEKPVWHIPIETIIKINKKGGSGE